MNIETILAIVSGLLGIGTTVLAVWVKKVRNTLKEMAEVLLTVHAALEDDKVTPEEAKKIAKEAVDVYSVLVNK